MLVRDVNAVVACHLWAGPESQAGKNCWDISMAGTNCIMWFLIKDLFDVTQ